MKQKDLFVGIAFFTFAIGLGILVAQAPPNSADQFAQMEPAAGETAEIKAENDMDIVTEAQAQASSADPKYPAEAVEPEMVEVLENNPDAESYPAVRENVDEDFQVAPSSPHQVIGDTPEDAIPQDETEVDMMRMGRNLDQSGGGEESAPVSPSDVTNDNDMTENFANDYDLQEAVALRTIGSPNAPYTVYEFSSLSCPHCADFHEDTFPKIKEEYIDTGKIRWVFVPFPNNEPALMGFKIAQCVHPRRHERMLDLLYSNQRGWAFSQNPRQELFNLVRIAGVDKDFFERCLTDEMLENALIGQMQEFAYKFNISGTPSFIVNEKKYRLSGALSFRTFKDKLETVFRIIERENSAQ